MNIDIVALVSRILHILPAVVLVGGLVYQRFVYVPAIARMSEAERDELQTAMRRPWALLVMISTLLLLVSGLYNTARVSIDYQLPPAYHALLGIKILLALAIFALSALLTGKTAAAVKMRQNQAFWLNVNLALAVVLICVAAFGWILMKSNR